MRPETVRIVGWFVLVFSAVPVTARAADLLTEERVFRADVDQSMQRYVLLRPGELEKGKSYDVLIALHGHGSDQWQFIKDGRDECRAARDVAKKHDMIFVSPDYRAKTSWMGPKAEADVVQIISTLKKDFPVNRVILCGGSMGGSSALTFTALHPELIDGVASMNGTANHVEYNQFQDAIRESFGGTKQEKPEEYKKRSAELWPERFTMPVGITAGGKDKLVPPDSAIRLAKKLKEQGRETLLIFREDGGHSTTYDDGVAILEYVIERSARPAPASR